MSGKRKPAEPVWVVPSPRMLERGDYLAGVPATGAYVDPRLAEEWERAGLIVYGDPPATDELQPGEAIDERG